MKTYVLEASVEQEDDGRWSAWVEALPGCAAWGMTKEEALSALQDAAEAYIEDMVETGEAIPGGVHIVNTPVVTVTV